MSEHDDITGIFDHLTPEDFFDTDPSAQKIPLTDGCSFDDFIVEQLTMLRYAFAACDGNINPITVLANKEHAIVYQANDDENLGGYITRMNEEARKIGARWAFFYKRTLIAQQAPGNDINVGDATLMEEALVAGRAQEAVYWYASRNDDIDMPMRHGYAAIEGTKLGDVSEGPEQPNDLLNRILGGG
jgi:hypothetical protein